MGQPIIEISFKPAADTTMRSSGSGVVGLILSDGTKEDTTYAYKKGTGVVKSHWTAQNLDYIDLVFQGSPKQVIVERVSATEPSYEDAIKRMKQKKVNFLAIPGLSDENKPEVTKLLKAMRKEKCTIKTVLANTAADDEGIINFCSESIKVTGRTAAYSAQEYTAKVAGCLAGLPLDRSATYYILSDVESFTESTDPDGDVDAGKLILLNDGENIKFGRAVTSLTTVQGDKSEDMKKIKIVTDADMMVDDIKRTFEKQYVGMNNSYDNKIVFMNAIKEYFKQLVRYGVLDDTYEHTVELDVDAIREYLGDKAANMTDDEVKRANTGSYIFLKASVKFSDAIEDLKLVIHM